MADGIVFYKETEFKDTEIGRIPKEWEVVNLEGACVEITDGSHWSPKQVERSEYRIATVANLRETYIDIDSCKFISEEDYKCLVKEGDVPRKDDILFSKDGTVGITFTFKQDSYKIGLLSSIAIMRPNHELLFSDFGAYALKSPNILMQITGWKTGTALRRIILDNLKRLKIMLPPLHEQRKIASILSTVDESIQKTDDIIAKTERLKKGLMQELLTKGIGHREFKDTKIGKLPEEWEVRTLGEIGEPSRGLSYRGHEKFAEEVSGSYLFLTLNSIKEGGGLKENGWSWIRTDRLRERHFVREGDIVIANTEQSKDGSLIGSPAIVYFPSWYRKDRAVYSMDLSKLQLKSNLHHKFLFCYLSYVQPIARKYQTGTNVWHLNLDAWSNELSISLPPLEEQQKIAEILSTVDEKVETLKLEKAKLERIKQWFMEELLSGRIRVRVA
jgi:type I restriction enzyme S subunit